MEQRHRGGLIWPVILIGAGVIFLLNNLGMLGWGVWAALLRLWPVLLIALGLEILIGRRSLWGSLVVILLLGAAFTWAIANGGAMWPAGDTIERTEAISVPLAGAKEADVELSFGTGELRLGALQEGAGLIEGRLDLGRGEQANWEARGKDPIYFKLSSQNAWFLPMGRNWYGDKRWELSLSRDVSMRLKINTGVSQANLDLSQLNLSRLNVNGGVGQTTLTLPRRGNFRAEVDSGVGEMIVIIPAGMAASISVNTGLGDVNVTGKYDRQGSRYVSPQYNSAANRVELSLDGGVGRMEIRFGGE